MTRRVIIAAAALAALTFAEIVRAESPATPPAPAAMSATTTIVPAAATTSPVSSTPVAPPTEKPDALTSSDAVFVTKLKEIRLIEIKSLRSPDAGEFAKGRLKILDLKDDTYVGPLVSVLYGPNVKYRSLLLDSLKEFAVRDSAVAKAYLQEIAVGDAAVGNRRRAIDALKAASPSPPTDRLMVHLAIDEVPAFRDRAAMGLALLGDKRAAWLMIDRLVTEEFQAVLGEVPVSVQSGGMSVQSVGKPKFRHAVVQGVAAGGATISQTIDLPEVDAVDVSSPMFSPTITAVVGIQRVQVQHPDMLSALRTLTGKNFGYDKEAWRTWMASGEGAKVVPAWKPMKFTAE
jgi:hypothetical protein